MTAKKINQIGKVRAPIIIPIYGGMNDPYNYGDNIKHTNGKQTWELLYQIGLNNLVNKAKNKIHNAIFLLEIE
jgi:hypothetical protein